MKSVELNKLYNRYCEDKLAHAFLLETNNIELCFDDVLLFIKMINCPKTFDENCNFSCNLCSLIDSLNLPSLYVINPDGMYIKKSQILDLQDRFSTKPIYSKFNVYIVKECDRLNNSSANTMLKFLEEPADNIIGFFITNNKENVISTIKSRCQIIKVDYDDVKSLGINSDFIDYINAQIKEDYDKIFMERKDFIDKIGERKGLEDNYSQLLEKFVKYNFYLSGIIDDDVIFDELIFKKLKKNQIIKMIEMLKIILMMIKSNVNLDLILDSFYFEMRDIYD